MKWYRGLHERDVTKFVSVAAIKGNELAHLTSVNLWVVSIFPPASEDPVKQGTFFKSEEQLHEDSWCMYAKEFQELVSRYDTNIPRQRRCKGITAIALTASSPIFMPHFSPLWANMPISLLHHQYTQLESISYLLGFRICKYKLRLFFTLLPGLEQLQSYKVCCLSWNCFYI